MYIAAHEFKKKMKVAFFLGRFPAISETFILNQITGLIDRGCKIDIYADSPGNETTVHSDVRKYGLLDKTEYYGRQLKSMPENALPRLFKGASLFIKNFRRSPRLLLKSINFFSLGRSAISMRCLYGVIPFLKMSDYDIVHCHFGTVGQFVAELKRMGALRGRLITAFHGYDVTQYIKQNGRNVYARLFRNCDIVMPISEKWKNELARLGCEEEKIVVHRMGIDTEKYYFNPRVPRAGNKIRLLTVARLVEKKGIAYAIEAAAKIIKKFQGVEYSIVGDGPLKADLEITIKRLNMSGNIKLVGWKTQDEIIDIMKNAHILLAPSVTCENGDQEGIPVVLMEAMAQGIPVISTFHSGIPELVQDGISGSLVNERDVPAIVNKLEFLINNSEACARMAKAGREIVIRNYDINKLNDRLMKIYRQSLN